MKLLLVKNGRKYSDANFEAKIDYGGHIQTAITQKVVGIFK